MPGSLRGSLPMSDTPAAQSVLVLGGCAAQASSVQGQGEWKGDLLMVELCFVKAAGITPCLISFRVSLKFLIIEI